MQASFLTNTPASFAASLDARIKLGLCAAGSFSILLFSSPISLAVLLLPTLALALTAAKLRTIMRILLFATLMSCITLGFSVLLTMAKPDLMHLDAFSIITPYLRMLVALLLLMTLALSTPIQVIVDKIQWFRLPSFLYIPITIAIRFIPVFMADCKQICDAAKLRPGKGLRSCLRGLMIPLIFRTLSSADDLAVAASLKGIQAQQAVVLPEVSSLNRRDWSILSMAGFVFIFSSIIQIWGPQFTRAMS